MTIILALERIRVILNPGALIKNINNIGGRGGGAVNKAVTLLVKFDALACNVTAHELISAAGC